MTDKELRKLNRSELLEMLLEQSREIDSLNAEVAQAREQLNDRQLMLDDAGSIAEASLRIHQVFESAQQAADQYLENIQTLSGRQESICARLEEESRRSAQQLLEETQAKCQTMEAETKEKCERMTREAKEQADRTWAETKQKLDQFLDQQAGLRALLGLFNQEMTHT